MVCEGQKVKTDVLGCGFDVWFWFCFIFSHAFSGAKNLSNIDPTIEVLENIMIKCLVSMLAHLLRYPLLTTWVRRILNVLLHVFENYT